MYFFFNGCSENLKLHQLANKISDLALVLSEIISNLRKSEIDIMLADCRAAGMTKNSKHFMMKTMTNY